MALNPQRDGERCSAKDLIEFLTRTLPMGVADLLLFVHALRLARRAGSVSCGASVNEVISTLSRLAWLPVDVSPAAAARATRSATSRAARWFGAPDTCLLRSLVLGTLVSDRPGVSLHVQLAAATTNLGITGHAWVSVDGMTVAEPYDDELVPGGPGVFVVPFDRRRRVR